MHPYRLLPCLVAAAMLAGCAAPEANVALRPPATLEQVMAQADAAHKAGQYEQAQQLLRSAAGSFPTDKAPWLQLAQMKFERNDYGDAIQNALAVLQRDPDDQVANSIVAVSGLRLSGKALADLSRSNHLNGSLRSEAQDLARLLRASLGEDVLASGAKRPGAAAPKRAASGATSSSTAAGAGAAPASGASKPAAAGDPFSGLK